MTPPSLPPNRFYPIRRPRPPPAASCANWCSYANRSGPRPPAHHVRFLSATFDPIHSQRLPSLLLCARPAKASQLHPNLQIHAIAIQHCAPNTRFRNVQFRQLRIEDPEESSFWIFYQLRAKDQRSEFVLPDEPWQSSRRAVAKTRQTIPHRIGD